MTEFPNTGRPEDEATEQDTENPEANEKFSDAEEEGWPAAEEQE